MRLRFATSIKQLILFGFFLTVLPLAAALISSFHQIDSLSKQIKQTFAETSSATESSRIIVSQTLGLERAAGQYWVLREEALLQRYREQRQSLLESIDTFRLNPLNPAILETIDQLILSEKQLLTMLQEAEPKAQKNADTATLPDLSAVIRELPTQVSDNASQKSRSMSERINQVEGILLLQVVALIPLAIVFTTVFGVLIGRPLRQVGRAIQRLGSADLSTKVAVSGPQDVRQLGEHLEWLRQRLAELDQQKIMFLQHVSHELKTPLTAIREGTSLLRDQISGPLTADQKEVVNILEGSSQQLQKEVEALLDFNFALSQEKLTDTSTLRLDELIKQTLDKHKLAIKSGNIKVQHQLSAIQLVGNRIQLLTVLDNIISNAIKYTPNHGEIQLQLQLLQRQQAVLDIQDSGPGIAIEDETHIFEPFYQGKHRHQGSVSGTGLGLAIAQRYVLLHHGRIELLSSQAGAHFRICLPLLSSGARHAAKQ